MAQSSKGPRSALSPKYRKNPVKEEAVDESPEMLSEERLAPDDAFVHASAEFVDWLVEKKMILTGIAGAGLLLAVGASLYSSHQADKELEVASEVFKASRQMPTQAAEVTDEDKAKYKEAAKALEAVAGENSGATAATVAELYAGYSFLQAGEATEAVRVFQAVGKLTEPSLENFALNGLAAAHSMAGNQDAAIDTLRKASTDLKGVFQQSALMDLGRSLEGVGKASEAVTAYERLLTDHPYSAFADDATARLKSLKPDSPLIKTEKDGGSAEAPASE